PGTADDGVVRAEAGALDLRRLRRLRRRGRPPGPPVRRDRAGADGQGARAAQPAAADRPRRRAGGQARLSSQGMSQASLFDDPPPAPRGLPPGLVYEAGFLSRDEEAGLVDLLRSLPFTAARYKGYTAR